MNLVRIIWIIHIIIISLEKNDFNILNIHVILVGLINTWGRIVVACVLLRRTNCFVLGSEIKFGSSIRCCAVAVGCG